MLDPNHTHPALVLRVIDADTLDVEVDADFRLYARMPLRVAYVNAPERYTEEGKLANDFATRFFGTLPCPVIVRTYKPVDKYGRYLAQVERDGTDYGQALMDAGHAVYYNP